ncbi:MAG: adenine phosphoribosyltransferase, partial [Firmicutes bacterium]|nr:adenine phosphoribosyltransferase [Bacillota bacterium]
TDHIQKLCLGKSDAEMIRDKRILIVDDVISTGESLKSVEVLVDQVGGNIVGRMTVLAEGEAADRDDIIYLQKLPLFDKEGNPIE